MKRKEAFEGQLEDRILMVDVTICTKGHVLRISIIDIYSIRVRSDL